MIREATVSEDGLYRYALTRRDLGHPPAVYGDLGTRVLFIMLNPSTADGTVDDPTIRRCVGFARAWGYDRLDVANLYAYRATSPDELNRQRLAGVKVTGPSNERHLRDLAAAADLIVAAWGAASFVPRFRIDAMRELLRDAHGGPVHRIGPATKDGHPRHPLYLKADTPLEVHWR